jgi:hypothetical protein
VSLSPGHGQGRSHEGVAGERDPNLEERLRELGLTPTN